MRWVLMKADIDLPERLQNRIAERVLAAEGADRHAALEGYLFFWKLWFPDKGMGDETIASIRRRIASTSPAERLRALGQVERYVGRTDWAELYGRRDRLRAGNVWDRRAIELAL